MHVVFHSPRMTMTYCVKSCMLFSWHNEQLFGAVQMDKVNKWTTENVNALKKRLKALRQKVAEARDTAARRNLEEVISANFNLVMLNRLSQEVLDFCRKGLSQC